MAEIPYEVTYTAQVPLRTFYSAVLKRRAELENEGLRCSWRFVTDGEVEILYNRGNRIFDSLATIGNVAADHEFGVSFSESETIVSAHGSTKTSRNVKTHQALLDALGKFHAVTGIELLVENR